jgi:Permuted papain-like amidase enzyme, YaeF/YiiX, C92 family
MTSRSQRHRAASRLVCCVATCLAVPNTIDRISYSGPSARPQSVQLNQRLEQLTRVPLANGDLIFRRGNSLVSQMVLAQTAGAHYSHVGILVIQGTEQLVVHAIPNDSAPVGGVVIEPLHHFLTPENAADFAIYRDTRLTDAQRHRIRDFATRQIGKPFDDQFRMSDDRRMYCTKLALKAYAAAGEDLLRAVTYDHLPLLAEPVVPPDNLRRLPLLARVDK